MRVLAFVIAAGCAFAQLPKPGGGGGGGGGSGTPPYAASFSAATTVSVTAATHGKGTNPIVEACYDNSTPRQSFAYSATFPTAAANGDVVVTWSGSKTGVCYISAGDSGGTGATGAAGATGPTGPTGPSGTNGTNGAAGATGPTGPAGPTGPTGPTGASGLGSLTGVVKASSGTPSVVTGTSTNCVLVDGSSATCGTGGGASTYADLETWRPVRTDDDTLTIPCSSADPCPGKRSDGSTTLITGDIVIDAIAGSGEIRVSYDPATGTVYATRGTGVTDLTCTNCTEEAGDDFHALTDPAYFWTTTSSVLAATGTDYRSTGMGGVRYTAGTNMQLSGGAFSVGVNVALISAANSWADGVKQTFNPDGTNAGINVGSQAGDPSSLANGDVWYNSSTEKFRCRENGSTVNCIGGGSGTVTSVAQSFTGGLISVGGSPVTTSGTLALTVAGTSGGIPYFSSSSAWASSGALGAGDLVAGGGAGATPVTTVSSTRVNLSSNLLDQISANGSGTNRHRIRSIAAASNSAAALSFYDANSTTQDEFGLLFDNSGTFEMHVLTRTTPVMRFLATGLTGIGQTAPIPTTTLGIGNMTATTGVTTVIVADGQGQSTANKVEFRAYNATFGSGTLQSAITSAGAYSGPSALFNGSSSGVVTIQPAAAAGTWSLTLPTSGGTNGYFLQTNGSGVTTWAAASGSGDVTAASSFGTDNRVIRSDGTGKGVQTTGITVDDSDNVTGAASVAFGADPADAGAVRCSNNAACIAAEIATPGTDMTITPNSSDLWAFSHGITAPSITTTGSTPFLELPQGTASSPSANSVRIIPPTSISTAYTITLPGASATGFMLGTDSSNVNTITYVGFSGTGSVARVDLPSFTTGINLPNATPTTSARVAFDTSANTITFGNGASTDRAAKVNGSAPSAGLAKFAGSTYALTSGTAATGDLANNAVTSAKMAVVNTRRVCDMAFGNTNGSALANGDLGPQKRMCFIPAAATVVEVNVAADGGTPSIIVARNVAGTVADLVSSALATAASGGIACSKTSAVTGIDGATTCSATLQNTALAAGSYLEAVSGTAGGTAKLMTVHIVYTID